MVDVVSQETKYKMHCDITSLKYIIVCLHPMRSISEKPGSDSKLWSTKTTWCSSQCEHHVNNAVELVE